MVRVRESRGICMAVLIVGLFFLLAPLSGTAESEEGEGKGSLRGGGEGGEAQLEGPQKVVARVNGAEIAKFELNEELSKYAPRKVPHSQLRPKTINRLTRQSLDNLITKEIKYQEAKRRGLALSSEEEKLVAERIAKLKERRKNLDDFLTYLGKDKAWLQSMKEKPYLIKKLEKQVRAELTVEVDRVITEGFVKAYYESNVEKFREPERKRLRELLIKVDPGGGTLAWDKGYEKTKELRKRIEGGEDFAAIAKEYSEDKFAEKGGDMGYVHKGSLEPRMEGIVEDMEVGEIAGPIWTLRGYYLVKVEEKTPPVQKSYEEVSKKLMRELKAEKYKKLYSEWFEGLRDTANIVVEI
jgi:peptidyl-prolyl cis-trans isomerase C